MWPPCKTMCARVYVWIARLACCDIGAAGIELIVFNQHTQQKATRRALQGRMDTHTGPPSRYCLGLPWCRKCSGSTACGCCCVSWPPAAATFTCVTGCMTMASAHASPSSPSLSVDTVFNDEACDAASGTSAPMTCWAACTNVASLFLALFGAAEA